MFALAVSEEEAVWRQLEEQGWGELLTMLSAHFSMENKQHIGLFHFFDK